MIRRHWVLVPLAATLIGASPVQAPLDAAAASRVRAHVEFLADDQLEGREAGTRGHELAALYVASQFRSLGLQPAGDNGSWYQRVPFRRATAEGAPTLSLVRESTRTPLQSGKDAAIRPSLYEKQRKLEAPLVFAGYGLKDRQLGIDDYRGLDVRGKIAVVLEGVPEGLPAEVAAHLGSSKDRIIAQSGALGYVTISRNPEPDDHGLADTAGRPMVGWVDAQRGDGSVAPQLRVRMSVSEETAQRLFEGSAKSLADVRRSAQGNARPAGFDLPGLIAVEAASRWQDFTSPAVLGLIPGSDPKLRSEHVLLMGHLDHLGINESAKPGEDAINNGALDNAAGIATMIEAARAFTTSGKRPGRSILFIAHTGEEIGLLGADYWAAHSTVPLASVAAAVNLDMPVPLYQFNDVVAFGADHSNVARTVAAAGATMGIKVSPDPMPEQSIFVRSDHYPLARRGVPAILLFTGYGSGGKAIWDKFFATTYHSVRDDLSQPILWDAAARYAQLNYRIARRLADDPQRPRWYQGSYFGETFAPTQAKAKR